MSRKFTYCLIYLGCVFIVSCGTPHKSHEIEVLVNQIVEHSNANDIDYFESLLEEPYKGQASKLIDMIKRSGIQNNYEEYFSQDGKGHSRLNGHDFKNAMNIQIDLKKEADQWRIVSIWFCK